MNDSHRGRAPEHGERYPSAKLLREDEPKHRAMLSPEALEALRKRDRELTTNKGRGRK